MNAHELDELRRLIRREAGIVLDSTETYAIESRIEELARQERFPAVAALLERVETGDRDLLRRVCEAVTVHETRFFRDERTFRALFTSVLPDLVRSRTTLRVWCAAIASGQEAYSVAMLIQDYFPSVRAEIVGTDLSHAMLARATRAVYSDFEVNRGLTPAQRARHLIAAEGGWQIRPELQAMVKLSPLNLVGPWPSWDRFDLVLLRNVLVYLDEPVRTRILTRTRAVLADDGVLLLGATEMPPPTCSHFARSLLDDATFYRPVKDRT